MKIKKVIEELQHYLNNYGEDVEVNFKMLAPENVCDDDTMDINIDFIGEIGTSGLLGDVVPPVVEMGFSYQNQNDWSEDWKKSLD